MWDCATKKHEAYKVAILKSLAFLATRANLQDLHYLFQKLKSLQTSEIDKFDLALLKAIAKRLVGDSEIPDYAPQSKPITGKGRSSSFSKFKTNGKQNKGSTDDVVRYDSDNLEQAVKRRQEINPIMGQFEFGNGKK